MNFWLDKANNCMFFLNCCRLAWACRSLFFYPYIIYNFLWNSCLPEMENNLLTASIVSPPNSLNLAKFCNIIIILLYFTCSIVFTPLNQFLNLCSCNHWNWNVIVRLVCCNLTLQRRLRFSDVFTYLCYCS